MGSTSLKHVSRYKCAGAARDANAEILDVCGTLEGMHTLNDSLDLLQKQFSIDPSWTFQHIWITFD